jgi:hypothetical protein
MSSGATFVAMMQTAHFREGDDGACRGWLYGARFRAILVEREMSPAPMMILKICRQHRAQVMLIEDDDVIETFAADRADDVGELATGFHLRRPSSAWRQGE